VNDQSPLIDQLGRLASLLREYNRDDVWLHVTQVHPFTAQDMQVVVAVTDKSGLQLQERPGRPRSHTFRLNRNVATIGVGHQFHVVRDESGVRVRHVPAYAASSSR
jgi:hypothetical protein